MTDRIPDTPCSDPPCEWQEGTLFPCDLHMREHKGEMSRWTPGPLRCRVCLSTDPAVRGKIPGMSGTMNCMAAFHDSEFAL